MRRYILGIGYPWFNSSPAVSHYHGVSLRDKPGYFGEKLLALNHVGTINSTVKIRLVAEVVAVHKKRKR